MGDGAPCGRDSVGDHKGRPYPRTTRRRAPRRGDPRGRPSRDPRGRPSRDPRGRPSRIQHGLVSFVRGGVPRPCGVPYRPERGRRETGMGDGEPCGRDSVGDHKGRPYTRTTRRRAPRRGDPRGRPSRDPRGRPSRDPRGRPSRDPRGRPSRIQHGLVSFVRGGVPRLVASRTDPNEAVGKPAWATARPAGAIAWATTRVAPTPEQLGDEPRVGATLAVAHPATLAVAHPESSTASFPSCEVASHALAASRTDPNEAIGKPAWATASPAGAIAWATTSVAPTPEQLGDEPRVGATLAVAHPATLAVAHPESSTASFPSCEVASHALAASRTDPNEAIGKPAWATASPAGAIAWATTSVAPTPEQLGDEARVGATLAVAHPATLAVAHPESSTASFPSCEVASHALVASRTDPNEAVGKRHGRRRALRAR